MAYTEAYDSCLNVYRTVGRFRGTDIVELFFFDADIVYTWDQTNPAGTCSITSFSSYPQNNLVRPSPKMFDMLVNTSSFVYGGQTTEVRLIQVLLHIL